MKVKRVIKQGECLNLSSKYKLTYHVGIDDKNAILIRVSQNAGGGYFSPEWVALDTIFAKLESAKKPLTSFSLHGIFEGKSANTPGFVFAVLYAEGLVERDIDNPRVYVSCDAKPVIAEFQKLIDSGVDIKVSHIPDGRKTISKVEPTKKQAAIKTSQ